MIISVSLLGNDVLYEMALLRHSLLLMLTQMTVTNAKTYRHLTCIECVVAVTHLNAYFLHALHID